MKIDRLISIIMILLKCEKISAAKLAEMFEVSPRTIYRDIDTIELAGIPIMTYPGANGGIGIMERYKVDKNFFSESDISALLMGLGTISTTQLHKDMVGTIAKVKNLIPDKQLEDVKLKASQVSIDLSMWGGNRTLQIELTLLKRALEESRYITFKYSDRNGNRSERKCEPYQLVFKEGSWYLQGYCFRKEDFRVFKLIRMSELEINDAKFKQREFHGKPLTGEGWIENKLIDIKLLIDESLKEKIVERCGEEVIESYDNGKYIVNFPFIEDETGYSFLLSFGDSCECLAPEHVRRELTNRIRKILNIYTIKKKDKL